MPIETSVKTKRISRDEFYKLDYKVMGLAFSVHNDFGKFWNENIYQKELAFCCRQAGFDNVLVEVPITVSYKDFYKKFYVDLLIDDAVLYELKAVKALSGEHQRQTLNYMFLLDMSFGKLMNFSASSLEYRFVTTNISTEERFKFAAETEQWIDLNPESKWLKELMVVLLQEWGAFLDTDLFVQAICHFLGGEEQVVTKVAVFSGRHQLGYQKMALLTPQVAIKISSVTTDFNYYEQHLLRLVRHTRLQAIQWINFNHARIQFKTIMA